MVSGGSIYELISDRQNHNGYIIGDIKAAVFYSPDGPGALRSLAAKIASGIIPFKQVLTAL